LYRRKKNSHTCGIGWGGHKSGDGQEMLGKESHRAS
jgi:hypothetical protein